MDEQKRQFGARISQLIKTGAPQAGAETEGASRQLDARRRSLGGPDESMPDFWESGAFLGTIPSPRRGTTEAARRERSRFTAYEVRPS